MPIEPTLQHRIGPKSSFIFLILMTLFGSIRSLIHMFAPDSGAQTIAGIALEGISGQNLIAIIGQWGASQLVMALFGWAIILRFRSLTTFALGMQLIELSLRFGIGHFKPLSVMTPPPGAISTWVLLPITLFFWLWSFKRTER